MDREKTEELRAKFVANRERVRSWRAAWDLPEVVWPEVSPFPSPHIVLQGQESTWLEENVARMAEYWWLLEATPLTGDIRSVDGMWWFGEGHGFERLLLNITAVADPQYLAETLASGVHAAALRGWTDDDAQGVYSWLLALLNERPLDNWVRAKNRKGHVLVEAIRWPHSRTEFEVRLTVTETDVALDGTPLDDSGRPIARRGGGGAPAGHP